MKKLPLPRNTQPQQLALPLLDLSFLQLYSHQIRDEGLAARLGASAFTLFIVMRSFCHIGGKDDGLCRMSIAAMERSTGLSRPTITKCLKALEKEKLITTIQQDTNGTRKYYLMDTFNDKNTKQPIATVVYKPTEAATVRSQLAEWSRSGDEPKHPSVTLIQVNNTTNNITLNVTIDPSKVEHPGELAPWIEEIMARVQKNRLTNS